MKSFDTSMGGDRSEFPDTAWSQIRTPGASTAEQRARRLGDLFNVYWRPIYKYVRLRWKKPSEEAKDLVQDFFIHILEGELLERYEPDRSRFRTFVKGALDLFVASYNRDQSRLKRGGGRAVFSIDDNALDLPALHADDPGDDFDREWALAMIEAAAKRVEADLAAQNKSVYVDVFKALERPDADRPSYADVAKRFGISEVDVSNYRQHVGRLLRRVAVDLIRQTVADEGALWDEFGRLTGER